MGDIATLLERAEEKLDHSKAEDFAKRPSPATASPSKTSATTSGRSRSSAACNPSSRCCPFAGIQQAAANVDESQFILFPRIVIVSVIL
jgi:signal recognition particle subunit SRP54